jgi:PhnB protein
MATVKTTPDGYRSVTPYLTVQGANEAIEYYKSTLGAKERMRMAGPDGKIGHAELEIGDSLIMLADEYPEMGARSPKTLGGSAVSIMIYVPDVDAVVERMEKAGGKILRPVGDQFYGDRSGGVEDPFGHRWHVSTHVEDVPPDEMQRRAEKAMAGA